MVGSAACVLKLPQHGIEVEGGRLLARRILLEILDLLGHHAPAWRRSV